ncbi:hypothetical protein D3C72_283800 [compost metagenome]
MKSDAYAYAKKIINASLYPSEFWKIDEYGTAQSQITFLVDLASGRKPETAAFE